MPYRCIAWLIITAAATKVPLCYESKADISAELPGEWKSGVPYGNSNAFARDTDWAPAWWNHACPAQMTIFSCYRHDTTATSHGATAENRRFVLSTCALQGFDPLAFLHRLRNGRLFFCCDSLAMQFFATVVCSLHATPAATGAAYHLTWKDFQGQVFDLKDCPLANTQHCHLADSTVHYPLYNVRCATQLCKEPMNGVA